MPRSKPKQNKTKYIFVSGGVISGIGKGITSASVALLLKSAGYSIAPIKLEGYLNIDAGTINPIEHGDTFLCEDGTEADMDLGTYEKFLHQDMGKYNFSTMGQVYQRIIEKERRFEYNGEDVEAVHITEEIIERIVRAGTDKNADIVIVELGGTAGEYWNIFYYEAARLLAFRSPGDVIHIHVSYVPTPHHLGEPKTKPTQLSVRTLNSMGIQPDFIIARAEKPLDARRKERFAIFCNMHPEDIISNPDVSSVYRIPEELRKQGVHTRIMQKLNLPHKEPKIKAWHKLVKSIEAPKKKTVEIAIVGKYFGTGEYQLKDSYAALFDAIDHASWAKGLEVKTKWVDAESFGATTGTIDQKKVAKALSEVDGIIVPIGWGERGSEGMIAAASFARKEKIPYLGLCFGMQLASVAFARDMLGWKDANTEENNPKSKHKVIHFIEAQKDLVAKRAYGGTMRLGGWKAIVKKGTQAWDIYNKYDGFINKQKNLTSERHRHRYEFNSAFIKDFEKKGFIISAVSEDVGLVEIIELPKSEHPFYMGTQGHPEYKSRPLTPHPIFLAFLEATGEKAA